MSVCLSIHLSTYVPTYLPTCTYLTHHWSIYLLSSICLSTCLPAYLVPTYISTYLPSSYIHTYLPTYLPSAFLPIYLHTYLPTYLTYLYQSILNNYTMFSLIYNDLLVHPFITQIGCTFVYIGILNRSLLFINLVIAYNHTYQTDFFKTATTSINRYTQHIRRFTVFKRKEKIDKEERNTN